MKRNFTLETLENVRRFLCVGAHCDDMEIRAGALCSRLIRQGARGCEMILVDGPWARGNGNPQEKKIVPAREIMERREQESRNAAAILGMEKIHFFHLRASHFYRDEVDLNHFRFYYPDFADWNETKALLEKAAYTGYPLGFLARYQEKFVSEFQRMIEEIRPDVIFTHSMADNHLDHYATACLVTQAMASSGILADVPLLFWHPGSRGSSEPYCPTHLIEVSEEDVELVCRAVECYESQLPPEQFRAYVRTLLTVPGEMAHVPFAMPCTLAVRNPYSAIDQTREFLLAEWRTGAETELIPLRKLSHLPA